MQTASLKGYRLSQQQERMWSLQKVGCGGYAQALVQIEGALDLSVLQQALQQMIERHSILRTVFYMVPGMDAPMQIIKPHLELSCPILNLEILPPASQQLEVQRFVAKQIREPFDLADGPLLRCHLLRLSARHHFLLLTLSALCGDASTLTILVAELGQAYAAAVQNGAVTDANDDPPLQYTDVSAWQNEVLQEDDADIHLAYWKQIDLSGLPHWRLPFEQEELESEGAMATDGFHPESQELALSASLWREIERFAQQQEVALSAFLLACWQNVLWRFSADATVRLGIACDGRHYEELSHAPGLYTRYIPLPTHFSEQHPFRQLLAQISESLDEAIEEQEYFTWQATGVAEHDAVPPTFPYTYEFLRVPSLVAGPLQWRLQQVESITDPFVLQLQAQHTEHGLHLRLRFDSTRLSAGWVQQLATCLLTQLQAALQAPDCALAELPLLSLERQQELLAAGRGSSQEWPSLCVHHLFEQQVRQRPDQVALVVGEEFLTYQHLNARANRLAHLLHERGVGPDVLVPLCLGRNAFFMIALLAVLKAGGAYVPLEPEQPAERVAMLLQDLHAPLLLTQQSVRDRLPLPDSTEVLCLDAPEVLAHLAEHSEQDLPPLAGGQDLAYVIYTSGSTGRPKGVLIEHHSLLNYTLALQPLIAPEPELHFGCVSTLAADLGKTMIYPALVSGGCVHLLPYEVVTDGLAFARAVAEQPLDVLKLVPSHLRALLASAQEAPLWPRKSLLLGGEAFPIALWRELRQRGAACRIYNHYGPTETTIGVLLTQTPRSQQEATWTAASSGLVPLGRALPNTQCYVLDEQQRLVPAGMIGELYVGGQGVARGYLRRAEQTRERFVSVRLPAGASGDADQMVRLYRTGDLVRANEQGELVFVGRADGQVKIRGYRVELGEIETVLRQQEAVWEVAVRWQNEQQRLIAYVVARQAGMRGLATVLRAAVRERLPEYMVPQRFVAVESLPLTANGKLDWRALPDPDSLPEEESAPSEEERRPQGPLEELVAQIWSEVLHHERIERHDNFFELGGHSLLATQVISRIRQVCGVELPILSLFEAPTVVQLSQRLTAVLAGGKAAEAPPLQPVIREQPLPLSFAQQRLWFLHQLDPDEISYNKPIALRWEGPLQIQALEQSLRGLVQRHEILRTTYQVQDGQPVQVIGSARQFNLRCMDLRGLAEPERERHLAALVQQEARRSFDLERGPVLFATLLLLGPQQWAFLLTMHHIVSDGWSNGIFVRELVQSYEAALEGRAVRLAPLPLQYADFAVWQREWLQREVLEGELNYWREHLAGVAPLNLPTDRPRPSVQTSHGAHMSRHFSTELTQSLKHLSQREGVTLFMTLLAAFQVLLGRYSRQEDIAVGSPIANRTRAEIEGVIGFFVNTLVMRTDLSGDPSFQQVLQRVRQMTLEAYAHQDVPFEKLVEALQPERDLSRAPLFQVMLTMENSPKTIERLRDVSVSSLGSGTETVQFDLVLAITDAGEGLSVVMMYNTDLFEADTITRLLGHWQCLLQAIVHTPALPLSRLPLLTTEENEQLLMQWNFPWNDYSSAICFHQLFEAQVKRTPDAIALVCEDHALSYHALNQRANQVAHHLNELGTGPEVMVGLSVERSIEMVIGLLGVLKAGGAYVPLDPTYPPDRLAFMLKDVTILITQQHLQGKLPVHTHCKRFCLDADWQVISNQSTENPENRTDLKNLAYVIYTSGSTGKPKGVLVSHYGLVNLLEAQTRAFAITATDSILQFASISFDASVSEILMAVGTGARLYVGTPDTLMPGLPLLHVLREQSITVATLPPSALSVLPTEEIRDLRTIIVAGEDCSQNLVQQWAQGRRFFNAYGPTEGTVCATIAECHPETAARRPSIGKPLNRTQAYILDANLQPVPINIPGELYIGGVNLARGYYAQPELTAERFIPHPFSKEPGDRLYNTGDLARYRADGTIEFIGRIDHQVKVRGFRIELGEIETVLHQFPGIRECLVVTKGEAVDDKQLVAYIIPNARTASLVSELRQYLKEKLPEYMVPAFFVLLDAFPLLPNGKVDRRALPDPATVTDEATTDEQFEGPRTPTEELLAGIWCELMKLERVGIHDNFFELGGHSLLATRFISHVKTNLDIELQLTCLFECPTIAELAPVVEDALHSVHTAQTPALIVPVSRTQKLPLSFSQQRLWFLDQLEPGNTTYNIPIMLRLEGKLHTEALEYSLKQIMQRHEILRTTFVKIDGQAVQVIGSGESFQLQQKNLSLLEKEERESRLAMLMQEELQRRFDLANGPLLFATLVRLSELEHALLLTTHHIVSDGWSNSIFIREFVTFYRAFTEGTSVELAPLPIQYADFALWQRQRLQGEALEGELNYWRQQLAGVTPLNLLTDLPRPPVQTSHGAHMFLRLSQALTEGLKRLSQQEGVTLFMTLLSAFQVLLSRYSGQEDIAVGTPIANRTRGEMEGLIGFFMNTLVMRTDLSGDPSFQQVLQQVRQMTLAAYAHQDIPFEKLVEALQPERDLSRSPLFQVMFTLQNTPRVTEGLQDLNVTSLPGESGTSKFDITLFTIDTAQGLNCRVEYNTDLFEAATITRLLEHWQCLLEAIVRAPSRRLSQLSLLTVAEREQLLVQWNATQSDYPVISLHELFEAQVKRTPDAIALVCEDHALSYHDLDQRANLLACHLQRLEVGPEIPVGVYAERSAELFVGLLAILKVGGVYVPLDPTYPTDRLAFMLEEAHAPVILTQRRFSQQLPTTQATVFYLDQDWPSLLQQGAQNVSSNVHPDQLAYVIYTSGSTGRPKGVAMSHRPLVNLFTWQATQPGLGTAARTLQCSSSSFDIIFNETFSTWQNGGCLYVVDEATRRDNTALLRFLVSHDIERAFLPFTALHQLAEAFEASHLVPAHLRAVLSTAEALQIDQKIREFFACMPTCVLYNEYGPSESHVVTALTLKGSSETWSYLPPIGKAIHNCHLYVLDQHLNPVPIGIPGELYIGSSMGGLPLARGYLHRPDLTAEKFIPDPFCGGAGTRLYKTGDLARYSPEGDLEYLGRMDQQVKIRGYRIELAEIEQVLSVYPGIDECVVVVREDTPGDKRLVAYLVAKKDMPGDATDKRSDLFSDALREYLRQKLPEYMLPFAFVQLDAFPLTPSGKVDRRGLPHPEGMLLKRSVAYTQPQTEVQRTIATIWQELLYVDKVGLHDNFFDLGGHSILAVQLHSKLQEVLQCEFALVELFKYPTVGSLASFLHQRQDEQPSLQLIRQRTALRTSALKRQRKNHRTSHNTEQ